MAEIICNPPDAAGLSEGSRSFGNYDLGLALADLIDNSITAGADSVAINCTHDSELSYIRIADNGRGMSRDELIAGMRHASKNPREERDKDDLGRFGLGLKTASFSQARSLTVVTRDEKTCHAATWDLDNISNWEMLISSGEEARAMFLANNLFETVTEVIWRKLDRVTEGGKISHEDFTHLLVSAADYLSLVFHRYMERQTFSKIKVLNIYFNGLKLEPHDPFKRGHAATQELETEELEVSGTKISITPYILPHFSKLPQEEYEQLAGEEGYIKNQGFYVYRNRRLIIHGTWFKLFRHGELSKLARVLVDIPNTLDEHWRITIDKSDAQIPTVLKKRLRDLIEKIGNHSSRVYRQRGSKINRKDIAPIWERIHTKGRIKFVVNTKNASIEDFINCLDKEQKNRFLGVLNTISGGFPIEAVHIDYSENASRLVQNDTDPKALIELAVQLAIRLMERGTSVDSVLGILKNNEPFSENYKLVVQTLRERKIIV